VINPVLRVGQVSDQVEVHANPALVETRSSAVGQIVENTKILEVPLNGRLVQELITLAGGAVQQAVVGDRISGKWAIMAVAGGTGFGTDHSLDRANHPHSMAGTTMPLPFPDATK